MKTEQTLDAMESTSAGADEIRVKAGRALFWVASTSIIWQVLSWALTLLTARVLSPHDYGIAALPGTVIPYLVLVANLRVDTWIIQRTSVTDDDEKAILTFTLLTGGAVALFGLALAPLIARFYEHPELTPMFQLCSLMFVCQSVQLVPEAMLRRELNFKALSLINLVVNIGQGLITFGMALSGFGFWALIDGIMFRQVVRAVLILMVRGWPRGFGWHRELYREALAFGIPSAGAAVLAIVFSTTDEVAVGKLFGTEVLGFYSMAYFFSQLTVSKIQMVIGSLLVPFYSKIRLSGQDVGLTFLRVTEGISLIAAPALCGLIVVAPEAVHLVLGEKWLPMVPALRVLCTVAIMQAATVSISPLLDSLGKPQQVFKYNLASALILPPSFFVFGYLFGVEGVYFAWLGGYPIVAYIMLRALNAHARVSVADLLKSLHAPVVSALGMALGVLAVHLALPPDWNVALRFAVEVLTGIALYAACLRLFFRAQLDRLAQLWRDLRASRTTTVAAQPVAD